MSSAHCSGGTGQRTAVCRPKDTAVILSSWRLRAGTRAPGVAVFVGLALETTALLGHRWPCPAVVRSSKTVPISRSFRLGSAPFQGFLWRLPRRSPQHQLKLRAHRPCVAPQLQGLCPHLMQRHQLSLPCVRPTLTALSINGALTSPMLPGAPRTVLLDSVPRPCACNLWRWIRPVKVLWPLSAL